MVTPLTLLMLAAVQQIGRPTAAFPEGFTSLTAVRELPDSRVLVLESCEEVIHLLDFTTRRASRVGRSGAGPGEYRAASGLWPLPGDSSVTQDYRNSRFLVIDPRGIPGRFFPGLPTLNLRSGRYAIGYPFTVSGADGRGGLYSRQIGTRITQDGYVRVDSVPLERWSPSTGRRDTAAFLRNLNPGPYRSVPDPPFQTVVVHTVADDGRVAVVYPDTYHVELTDAAGHRIRGRPIPWTPIPVNSALKDQWRGGWETGCPLGTRVIEMPGEPRPLILRSQPPREPRDWPSHLPPFLRGAARFAPDGTLWVRRTTPAREPARYDLIDRGGNLVRQVILPPATHLLGFGKAAMYLVRMDGDGLQYVERYVFP
jgi:hypothetical protein